MLFFHRIYLFVCQMEFMRFASLSCCLYFQVNRCIRSQILSHCIPLFFCLFVILTVRCVDALVDFVVVVFFSFFCFHLTDKSVVGKKNAHVCVCLIHETGAKWQKKTYTHTIQCTKARG